MNIALVSFNGMSTGPMRNFLLAQGYTVQTRLSVDALCGEPAPPSVDAILLHESENARTLTCHMADLTRHYPEIPVIVVAPCTLDVLMQDVTESEAYSYLQEPLRTTELEFVLLRITKIHAYLQEPPNRDELDYLLQRIGKILAEEFGSNIPAPQLNAALDALAERRPQ
jgi:hypothetical protein